MSEESQTTDADNPPEATADVPDAPAEAMSEEDESGVVLACRYVEAAYENFIAAAEIYGVAYPIDCHAGKNLLWTLMQSAQSIAQKQKTT